MVLLYTIQVIRKTREQKVSLSNQILVYWGKPNIFPNIKHLEKKNYDPKLKKITDTAKNHENTKIIT